MTAQILILELLFSACVETYRNSHDAYGKAPRAIAAKYVLTHLSAELTSLRGI